MSIPPVTPIFSGGTACASPLAEAPTEPRDARTEAAPQSLVQSEISRVSTNPAQLPGANNHGIQHSSVSVSLDGKSPAIRLPEAHKTVSPTCDGRPVPMAADRGIWRNNNPTFILAHARAMLIERLMAVTGRSRPREFRKRLENLDAYELRQFHFSQFKTC
jgi:hypothetical protein